MDTTLEEVASEADALADEQREIARDARRLQRQRDRGWSWAALLDGDGASGLLRRLRDSARRLTGLSGRVAATFARGLAGEGESRRQIARRLEVSHQRVSAILTARRNEDGAPSDLADR